MKKNIELNCGREPGVLRGPGGPKIKGDINRSKVKLSISEDKNGKKSRRFSVAMYQDFLR